MIYTVYCYKKDGKIVYIGKSKQLDVRIKQHCKEIKFYGLTDINYMIFPTEREMNEAETFLIEKYRPILNSKYEKTYSKEIEESWIKYEKDIKYDEPLNQILLNKEICKEYTDSIFNNPCSEYIIIGLSLMSYGENGEFFKVDEVKDKIIKWNNELNKFYQKFYSERNFE